MRKWLGVVGAWCLVSLADAAYEFPHYERGAQVASTCDQLMQEAKRLQNRLQTNATLAEFDALTQRSEDLLGPLTVLSAVHPQDAIRSASERCELRYQAFSNALFQDKKIYQQLQNIHPADAVDERYQRDLLDAFEDAGVALKPAQRAQAQQLANQIAALSQQFERRIREDRTRLALHASQLDGVPPNVYQKAPRTSDGRYQLGLDAPTVQAVLDHARLGPTRERFWRAYMRQGGQANLTALAQLTALRRHYAQQLGHRSFAAFVLRRRMAQSPPQVRAFLSEVAHSVTERERTDLQALQAGLAQPLHRWDVAYRSEQIRQAQFSVDQNEFRRYLPPQASLRLALAVAERLFGLRFVAQAQSLWHPDAAAYEVIDVRTERALGVLLVDLYPRPGKYNHAAVWSFRNVATASARRPAAALVTNLNRDGLSLAELEVLFHEFGHALHSLLSQTRYAAQGGTNTQLDFVEAPSQMLEHWVYEPQVMALMREVCATCDAIPPDMLARAKQAKAFGRGLQVARQHLFARYDLALYGTSQVHPLRQWQRMEGATALGYVPGSWFPAGFAHIAGGYAAGYYSYLWSQALAEDLFSAFENDPLNLETAARYRQHVLSQGGQVPPQEMVRRFLGRDFSREAFFKRLLQAPPANKRHTVSGF